MATLTTVISDFISKAQSKIIYYGTLIVDRKSNGQDVEAQVGYIQELSAALSLIQDVRNDQTDNQKYELIGYVSHKYDLNRIPLAYFQESQLTHQTIVEGQSSGGGSGSVTSIDVALPVSVFSASPGPVTSVGTIGFTFINQIANTVFAGPTTGSAAAPTFRSLVAADMPDLSGLYLRLDGAESDTSVSNYNSLSVNGGTLLQLGAAAVQINSGGDISLAGTDVIIGGTGSISITGANAPVNISANYNAISLSGLTSPDTGVSFTVDASAGNILTSAVNSLKYNSNGSDKYGILNFGSIASSDKTFTFPNASGTVALTSNVTAVISDVAYNATTWDGVTTIAPSKNAVRDQFQLVVNLAGTQNITGVKTMQNTLRIEEGQIISTARLTTGLVNNNNFIDLLEDQGDGINYYVKISGFYGGAIGDVGNGTVVGG